MEKTTAKIDENGSETNFDEEEEFQHVQSGVTIIHSRWTNCRNLVGFWFLGLCNNYAYVIMLSAAFDILSKDYFNADHNETEYNATRRCNPISTGAILLVNILPSLAIKFIVPFFLTNTHIRVAFSVLLSATSFLLTSLSVGNWMTYIGVICASLSSDLGEVSFLSFSAHFDKNVVSTWSSGTGGAGIFGALSYAALTSAGLSPRRTLQVMLVIPVMMILSFWVLIVHPPSTSLKKYFTKQENVEWHQLLVPESSRNNPAVSVVPANNMRLSQKVRLVKPLLPYIIPLSLVYFAGYFINQGLYELIYFQDIWLSHKEQYRWYQVDYQVGVFISRSSVNIIQFRKLWVLPIFQVVIDFELGTSHQLINIYAKFIQWKYYEFMNLVILLCEVYFMFFSRIWIMLTIVFFEGLLGGCAYVNTFYRISQEVESENREFSMGVSSVGDVIGISAAGAVALPVHDALCKLPLS